MIQKARRMKIQRKIKSELILVDIGAEEGSNEDEKKVTRTMKSEP